MIRNGYLSLMTAFFCFISVAAQNSIRSCHTLSPELVKGANAVVRLDQTEIDLQSYDKAVYKIHRVVTVLKKEGDPVIGAVLYYNPSVKVKNVEVLVYDRNGRQIKKIKEKEFKDRSAVPNGTLYGDNRLKYLDYTPVTYPYTIELSYEMYTGNTAFGFGWRPIEGYRVSTEKSVFSLKNAESIPLETEMSNFDGFDVKVNELEDTVTYSLANIPSYREEAMSPPLYQVHPRLRIKPHRFNLVGVEGRAESWQELGQWIHDEFLVGRDQLPETTLRTVDNLLAGIEDPIEKAKKIYEYVQENTRYISVQLGIGGWQPIDATEVDKMKYGDCKGLTNYTMALLKSQDIEANYAVVWAGHQKRDMTKDFSVMQGNHVILNIPQEEGEDIWLECTSQTLPFGFLGDFTDDRDVLLVTSEGGKIVHTTVYKDQDNHKATYGQLNIDSNGSIEADVHIQTQGIQYDDRSSLDRLSKKEQDRNYKEYWRYINGLVLNEVATVDDKQTVSYTEKIKLQAPNYAEKAGEDFILAINVLDRSNAVPSRHRSRKMPFQIQRGRVDTTSCTMKIPDGYRLKKLPQPLRIDSKYGQYESELKLIDDATLLYNRKLTINSGQFPKEEYSDYRDFKRNVAKADNQKLILTKAINEE